VAKLNGAKSKEVKSGTKPKNANAKSSNVKGTKTVSSKENKKTSDNNEKPKKKMSRSNFWYTVFMSVLFVFFVIIMYYQYRNRIRTSVQMEYINNQIEAQQAINDALNKEMNFKDTPEYIEKIAREKLGMVKPNEIVYIDENK
jgi:cell division protein FtsL